MNLSEPFIKRPVMTTMLTLGIVIFGYMAYLELAVSDLPSIDFPVITVTAQNPGMDPTSMANNVATPLEKEMMAIDGLKTIISTSKYGNTIIVLMFDLNKSIIEASTDVASAINNAMGNLPPEMPSPPSYAKANPSEAPVMYLAVSSESMTLGKLYDWANSIISQRLSMLSGVSQVQVFGSKSNIRVKLNPEVLSAMDLGINEVVDAVKNANQYLPAGNVYDKFISYTLMPMGQVESGESYEKIIIAERDGHPIYLKDLGKAVESTHDENYYLKYWDRDQGEIPTNIIAVSKQPGYNTVKLCDEIRAMLPELKTEVPASVQLSVVYDRSISIEESINDVQFTLLVAFILVVLVIFLFLGKATSTIIPSISLPVSILGAFGLMYVNNYSMDILSMLGLTLVIGFLVDDAIVVLENIVRHLDMGKKPLQAALDGSKQISTTVLSMTLSLSTVFIPMIFMPGIIGRMFHEMAMVVVIAVLLSGAISLTLTPTLCSVFLRSSKKKSILERSADKIIDWCLRIYEPALKWVLHYRFVPILIGFSSIVLALYLFKIIPLDFLPPGDTGGIQGITSTNQSVSLYAMANHQEDITEIIKKNPYVQNIVSVANLPEYSPSNQGILFISLIDINKRPPIDVVVNQLNQSLSQAIGIKAFIQAMPQISLDVGTEVQHSNYSYVLSIVGDAKMLYANAEKLESAMKKLPELSGVSTNILNNSPQLTINMLRNQASTYGISIKTIEEAIQYAYSGSRVSTYKTPLDVYDIVVQMEDAFRLNPDSLNEIRLKSNDPNTSNMLVPLNAVASWEPTTGPLQVNHNSQLPAATINFNVSGDAALSTALEKIQKLANDILSPKIIKSFQGQAQEFAQTAAQMGPLLIIGILIIYLLLGSLYENFVHPLTILSTLPGAIFGGLLTLLIFNSTLSIYGYVGMIVLVGIVLKNGIMLVEFANELVLEGEDVMAAIIEASKVRFRPILMTTIAASMGAVPIAIGIGADAATRRPMGLIILGGLLLAQLITYFFTPVMCYYSFKLSRRGKVK